MTPLEVLFGKVIYHDSEGVPGLEPGVSGQATDTLLPLYNDLELVPIPAAAMTGSGASLDWGFFAPADETTLWADVEWCETPSDATNLITRIMSDDPPAGTTGGTNAITRGVGGCSISVEVYLTQYYYNSASEPPSPLRVVGYSLAWVLWGSSIRVTRSELPSGTLGLRVQRGLERSYGNEGNRLAEEKEPAFIFWLLPNGTDYWDIPLAPQQYVRDRLLPMVQWADTPDRYGHFRRSQTFGWYTPYPDLNRPVGDDLNASGTVVLHIDCIKKATP